MVFYFDTRQNIESIDIIHLPSPSRRYASPASYLVVEVQGKNNINIYLLNSYSILYSA